MIAVKLPPNYRALDAPEQRKKHKHRCAGLSCDLRIQWRRALVPSMLPINARVRVLLRMGLEAPMAKPLNHIHLPNYLCRSSLLGHCTIHLPLFRNQDGIIGKKARQFPGGGGVTSISESYRNCLTFVFSASWPKANNHDLHFPTGFWCRVML